MALPENIKQLVIADAIRIIVDLNCLGMVAHYAVGRRIQITAGISDTCPNDAIDYPKLGLDAPKSAQTKGSCFDYGCYIFIDRRYRWCCNILPLGGKVHFARPGLGCLS